MKKDRRKQNVVRYVDRKTERARGRRVTGSPKGISQCLSLHWIE